MALYYKQMHALLLYHALDPCYIYQVILLDRLATYIIPISANKILFW